MSNEVDTHFNDEKSFSFKVPEHGSRFLSDGALTDGRGSDLHYNDSDRSSAYVLVVCITLAYTIVYIRLYCRWRCLRRLESYYDVNFVYGSRLINYL